MIKIPSNQIKILRDVSFSLHLQKVPSLCMQKRYAGLHVSLNIIDLADDTSSRGHVEERNSEVIANDSRLLCEIRRQGESKTQRIQDYVDARSFSFFSFSSHRSHRPDSSLLPLNPLSGWIIKRTMSPSRRTMGPPTYGPRFLAASDAGPTRGTLLGNECVTSPLESASTFAYRCPVLPPSSVSFPQVWNFFLTFLSRGTPSWSHRTTS